MRGADLSAEVTTPEPDAAAPIAAASESAVSVSLRRKPTAPACMAATTAASSQSEEHTSTGAFVASRAAPMNSRAPGAAVSRINRSAVNSAGSSQASRTLAAWATESTSDMSSRQAARPRR